MESPRPLGLPPGSIRALLALIVVILVIDQILSGQSPGLLLSETLLIVLAHYFAQRPSVALPPKLAERLASHGVVEHAPNPLWLPTNTIRSIIFVSFLITAVVLFQRGELLSSPAATTVVVVLIYTSGYWLRPRPRSTAASQPPPKGFFKHLWRLLGHGFMHLKALIIVLLGLILLLEGLLGELETMPMWMQELTLMLVLFYFGSR